MEINTSNPMLELGISLRCAAFSVAARTSERAVPQAADSSTLCLPYPARPPAWPGEAVMLLSHVRAPVSVRRIGGGEEFSF